MSPDRATIARRNLVTAAGAELDTLLHDSAG